MDPANLFDPSPGDFLQAVWGNGPHSLCYPEGGRFTATFADKPEAILERLPELQDRDVWFGAHPLRGIPATGRGSAEDVVEVVAIPADLDWDHPTRRTDQPLPSEAEVRRSLGHLGEFTPSVVVHSGHGLQVWWVLTNPITPTEAEQLGAQLDARLAEVGLENGRPDLASILRVPGTRNHKDPDQPVPVFIESLTDHRFTPEHLRKYLPAASGLGRSGAGTKHRRGAVTDAQQALADLLVVDFGGHSKDVWRDGSIHLVRPGKSAREGSSASIIIGEKGDAVLTVFTDHWPGLAPGSYVLGIDDTLHHPADPLAGFTMPDDTSSRRELIDVYQVQAGPDDVLPDIAIDWEEFARRDVTPHEWLVDDFWPMGRAMALYANAKEGKSELALWCAGRLAMGEHPWTGAAITPVDIAYFDFEMTDDDLDERLSDFGFDLDRLGRLHYALIPPIHALDTEDGGKEVSYWVRRWQAQAVIIDTFTGAVEGEEDKSDTVRAFTRHTGLRLKREHIAYLRTDHAGHDRTKKRPRGSSAKLQDVDVTWSLHRTQAGVRLTCGGATRLSWVGPILDVDRDVDPQTGEVSYSKPVRFGWPNGTAEKAAELDRLGVPLDAGRPAAAAILKAAGIKPGRNEVLGAALKLRRDSARTARLEHSSGTADSDVGQVPTDLFSDQP
jgi:hypothetical protein